MKDYGLAREHILPVIMRWFWLDSSGDWIVRSPDEESWHAKLRSLGRYRSGTIRNYYLAAYERVLATMRDVNREIRAELGAVDGPN